MASDVDVIREFLVSLGWKIDEKGQKKFTDTLAAGTLRAAELGIAVTAAATAVVAGVAKIAGQMESLYFASQRTQASVENIQALRFAAGQMGSTAEASLASLENLARFMRNSPGAEGLIHSIGVQTRGVNGELRDTTDILGDLGKQFARMPYYRANAYAQALGVDERTLMALREGMGQFGDEYRSMLAAAGLDSQQAAKDSHAFMNELRSLGSAFVILGQKIATSLAGGLSGDIRRFRDGVVDNFGRITDIIVKVVHGVLWLADVISTLSFRAMQVIGAVVDWFSSLDTGVKNAVIGVGALLIAWKLLSAGFLATPLGRVVALSVALLALYDDYKVWQAGGKSLIDWSRWDSQIEQALFGLSKLGRALRGLGKMASDAFHGNWSALASDWKTVQDAMSAADVGHGQSQADVDAAKTGGGARLTDDARRRLAVLGPDQSAAGSATPAQPSATRQPRGIRNNNPGNLNFAGQRGAQIETGPGGRFAVFQTAEDGLAALANQLRLYAGRGINSVREIIAKFAPPSENNTKAYIERVSGSLGVASSQSLNVNDPHVMKSLMTAIISVENGRNPYSAEQLDAASGTAAAGSAQRGVVINQTNSTVVHGAGDARATGQAVANAQDGANQRLIRNMRSPAS